MARLENICTINMGQSPDSASYNETGEGIPFFQGNADFGEINPKVRVWCSVPTKIAHDGDILISVRAPIGALNIANTECCIGRGLAALTVNEVICEQGYLWHAIATKVEELNAKGTGSTFKAISKNVLAEAEIPLPPIDQQQQIAATLDKVTDLISLRKQQITKLDELVKSQFIELFGDPVQNEKNWPMVRLADIALIRIGPFGSLLHREDYIKDGHALVNPSHIIDGAIVADRRLTVSEDKYQELSAYKLEIGDVVLGRRGEMGRCAVVYEDGFICGTGSLLIRSGAKIKPYFLQKIISYPTFKSVIEEKSVGVTMQNLNVPIVSNLLIPNLPLELQEQYINFVEQVDKSKFEVQKSLDKLQTMKQALMQQYFG